MDPRVSQAVLRYKPLRWAIRNRLTECVRLLLVDSSTDVELWCFEQFRVFDSSKEYLCFADEDEKWLTSNRLFVKLYEWRRERNKQKL